jgi:hypothetical protein
MEVFVIADLDTLLIALYVELTDRVIPAVGHGRRGPGRPLQVTDAELVCLAVAQVLLRYNDERHWLRAAPNRVGHLFPRLLGQSEYNQRLKDLAPLMDAALRWLAAHTPGSAELLRLLDGTPVGCGQSRITAKRSGLFGYAGYGYEPAHSRYYWASSSCCWSPPTGRSPGSVWPTPSWWANDRPSASCCPPSRQPSTSRQRCGHRQGPGRAGDRGVLRRSGPAADPPGSHRRTPAPPFPQLAAPTGRAVIWTMKRQLGLEHHGGRVPAGLWARVVQRLLALNTAIWHNWTIGAPVKRSLIAYDH